MDSINSNTSFLYGNVQQKIILNTDEFAEKRKEDKALRKKIRLANCPDDIIEIKSRQKAYNEYVNDPARSITMVVGAGIPLLHSVATGITQKGNSVRKTAVGLSTAKNWGLFIGGAILFDSAARFITGKVKAIRDFVKENPIASWAGMLIGSVAAGNFVANRGNEALTKMMGKTPEEKIEKFLEKSSFVKKEGYKKTVNKLSDFAKTKTGKRVGLTAGIGVCILLAKELYDLAKINSNISKSRESLKDKRYKASQELVHDLSQTKRNTQHPVSTKMQGIIIFSTEQQ